MNDLKNQFNLVDFARQYGPHDYDYDQAKLEPLCGDAGFRQYYRLTSAPSLMMVNSPPETERNFDTVRVNNLLAAAGVRAPELYAVDFESGIFALEDLGSLSLQDEVLNNDASQTYSKAIETLFLMQTEITRPEWIEDYSATLLSEEMALFPQWFLQELLGIKADNELIENTFQTLIESTLEQPQVFVHRDFHCRNLMMTKNTETGASQNQASVAVIDFQDAVWGPITYDLVSLARDCYLRWDQAEVDQLISIYAQRFATPSDSKNIVVLTDQQIKKFPKWCDLMGLQRHIKVLGVFARLALRDGKSSYLQDLPLVLRYTIENLGKYPEFAQLYQWFLNEVIPAASEQEWYSDWRTAGQPVNQTIEFT